MTNLDALEKLAREVVALVAVAKAAERYLGQYEDVYDCVDNDGQRYQSHSAAEAASALRSALAALKDANADRS